MRILTLRSARLIGSTWDQADCNVINVITTPKNIKTKELLSQSSLRQIKPTTDSSVGPLAQLSLCSV
jgi:hypothetical protein